VDDGVDGVGAEDRSQGLPVPDVRLLKVRPAAGDFLDAVEDLLLQRLSTTATSCSAFISSTTVWLPIKPAPPVTNTFMVLPFEREPSV